MTEDFTGDEVTAMTKRQTDYSALVERARLTTRHPVLPGGVTYGGVAAARSVTADFISQMADAVEALVAARDESERQYQEAVNRNLATMDERDEAVKQLAESRARFGDSEARRVELEAVIDRIRSHPYEPPASHGLPIWLHDVVAGQPSTVLAEHDQEVAARAWDEGFDAGERDVFEHDEHPDGWDKPCIPNPYRAADRNGEHA